MNFKKNNNNLYLFSIIIIWIGFSIFEIISLFFIWPKPMYWRAWEAVSNYTGKDGFLPFKPRYLYNGVALGDLLNVTNLKPFPTEIKKQIFQVDEYGFRNPIGMLNHPIKAAIIGSSFVAGAAETQKNLVSSLLTNKYNIPTYNAALYILQDYTEDKIFIDHPPKYLIMLGSEGEFISAPYRYTVNNRGIVNNIKKWKSFNEWQKTNDPFKWTYENISQYVKSFSILRYIVNNAYIEAVNFHRSRGEVVKTAKPGIATYDPNTEMLFYQLAYDNPLLGSVDKTEKDIDKAIATLELAKNLLAKRGTMLIVAAMPSKANLEATKYKNVLPEKRAIVEFEKHMDTTDIEHIDLFSIMHDYMKTKGHHLYYFDDGHWNAKTNEIISKLLADKIKELESNGN